MVGLAKRQMLQTWFPSFLVCFARRNQVVDIDRRGKDKVVLETQQVGLRKDSFQVRRRYLCALRTGLRAFSF